MNTLSIGVRHFEEAQSETTRAYAQSEQYHTIVVSRAHSKWASTSCTLNDSSILLQISSLHLRTSQKGEKSVTRSEAPHSVMKFGIVCSASP